MFKLNIPASFDNFLAAALVVNSLYQRAPALRPCHAMPAVLAKLYSIDYSEKRQVQHLVAIFSWQTRLNSVGLGTLIYLAARKSAPA